MSKNPNFTEQDFEFMAQAIHLAQKGYYSTKPNPAVGCVLVKNGKVIGKGWHKKAGMPHAEREALADVANRAKESPLDKALDTQGATAYVTLEPCSHHGKTPPCADGLIEAGIAKVVVAMQDPNPLVAGRGKAKLEQAGIDVKVGCLEAEAELLNPGFIHKMKTGLPFVRLKTASSLDGRTAMANGESKWITGAEARFDVHKMRAQAGALITGIGTVFTDDPSLNVRLTADELQSMSLNAQTCQPIRVVLDSELKISTTAKLFTEPGKVIIFTAKDTINNSEEKRAKLADKAEVVAVESIKNNGGVYALDLKAVLTYLAEIENVNDVMVESGAKLAGAFVEQGLVNELHSFIAPSLMGHQAKPLFELANVDSMQNKIDWHIQTVENLGKDIKLVLTP